MPTLQLRKDSIVSRALGEAESKIREQLFEAAKEHIARVYRLCSGEKVSRSYDTFEKHRAAVEQSIKQFEADVVASRAQLQRAFEEYDLNVKEITVWLSASQAAERIAP